MTWRPVPILPSRDTAATRAFWERLGFRVVDASADVTPYLIAVRAGAELHFRHAPALDVDAADASCYISVDDVDSVYAEWRELVGESGIPRIEAPTQMPWGLREACLVDPNGTVVRMASGEG